MTGRTKFAVLCALVALAVAAPAFAEHTPEHVQEQTAESKAGPGQACQKSDFPRQTHPEECFDPEFAQPPETSADPEFAQPPDTPQYSAPADGGGAILPSTGGPPLVSLAACSLLLGLVAWRLVR